MVFREEGRGVLVSIPVHRSLILTSYGAGQQFRTLTSRNDTFLLKSSDGTVDFGTQKRVRELNAQEIQTEWTGAFGLNWIAQRHHLVMGKVRFHQAFDSGSPLEVEGTLQWTTAWDRFRFSAGFQVGEHVLSLLSGQTAKWPIYPLLDIWLRI